MSSIVQKWGLGAELSFTADRAIASMKKAHGVARELWGAFGRLKERGTALAMSMGQIGLALTPVALSFGLAMGRGSQLAADLESQALTMRVMLGDSAKAAELLNRIRENAAATPFQEGDLIEGSKRLLRLTGDSVDANIDLLKLMETMAALNPTKSVVDSVEALLDATSGGGFERLKEFGLSFRAEDFAAAGRPGGKAWADAVVAALKDRMGQLTRGEDLVGALSQTFAGRLSTFRDSFSNLLRDVGKTLNERIGPMLGPLTDRVNRLSKDVVAGVRLLVDEVAALVDGKLGPLIDRMLGWWDGLGDDGRASIMKLVAGFGAFATVAVPLGGVLGAVGLALSGLLGTVVNGLALFGALFPATEAAAAGATGASGAFAAFGAVLWPLLAIGAAVAAVYAAMEDPWRRLGELWANLSKGFMELAGPAVERMRTTIGPQVQMLVGSVQRLLRLIGGDDTQTAWWQMLGRWLGEVAALAVYLSTEVLGLLITVASTLVTALGPVLLAIGEILGGMLDLLSGSSTVSQALTRMFGGVLKLGASLIWGIGQLIVGAIEVILRGVTAALNAIPGVQKLFGGEIQNIAADGLAQVRVDMSDRLSAAIAGVDAQSAARERAVAEASAPTVVAQAGETKVEVAVTAPVKVDSAEVARATGKAAVRAGERGAGPQLAPAQQARVLRGGLQVTPLRPTEVL